MKLVRPRKLAAYDGIPDLVEMTNFTLPSTIQEASQDVSFERILSNKFINLASLQSEISQVPEYKDWTLH